MMAYVRPALRERILQLANRVDGVTSRELEDDCYVSPRSSRRYLQELEMRGEIVAIGRRPRTGALIYCGTGGDDG